jgi:nucleoside 2-deoxyribosyltransferase
MNFYIASKLENAETVKAVANVLKAAGHIHTYDWTVHADETNESAERLAEIAELEVRGVRYADLLIVILPGGRGTHVELGMALRNDFSVTDIIICAESEHDFFQDGKMCPFYRLKSVTNVVGRMDNWLDEIFEKAREIDDYKLKRR